LKEAIEAKSSRDENEIRELNDLNEEAKTEARKKETQALATVNDCGGEELETMDANHSGQILMRTGRIVASGYYHLASLASRDPA